jgi:PadR family transcriptional regulator, regulatory protein PadR
MAELVPGTLEMLILRTLTSGQMHGYGIAQRIHNLSEGVLRVEEGSLYPTLQRLLRKGRVTNSGKPDWKASRASITKAAIGLVASLFIS